MSKCRLAFQEKVLDRRWSDTITGYGLRSYYSWNAWEIMPVLGFFNGKWRREDYVFKLLKKIRQQKNIFLKKGAARRPPPPLVKTLKL